MKKKYRFFDPFTGEAPLKDIVVVHGKTSPFVHSVIDSWNNNSRAILKSRTDD